MQPCMKSYGRRTEPPWCMGSPRRLPPFRPKHRLPTAERRNDALAGLHRQSFQASGNSRAGGESHQKFITKYHLNFPLLADTDGKIADAYGVKMTDRNMARRVSFLIGLDGKIAHVTDTPNADTHLSDMREAVGKFNKH